MFNPETPFLAQVANDLVQKFGNDLSRITVVFPNKRARLFFNEYLCQAADKPVWSPQYAGLNELFVQASSLQIADSLKLLAELYKVYIEIYNVNRETAVVETFDDFFHFGEILLNDFDDVDKNLVNSLALFSNLAELDELKDDFSHLEPEQWATITRFFKDITENRSQLKEAFLSIWNILGLVYERFKEKLLSENIAYEGMLFRSVVEKMERESVIDFPQEKYVFAGFNVLTECEKKLFKILKQNGKASFYWDFDEYYMNDTQEAGHFIKKNIEQFGNELHASLSCGRKQEEVFNSFTTIPKNITLIASPSESAQAGYIRRWLADTGYLQHDSLPDTAIVLCNEQNLQSVMYAIPSHAADGECVTANITMGFPLTQTPVFGFIAALIDLQTKGADLSKKQFRYNYILPVLNHFYTYLLFPEAQKVKKEMTDNHNFSPKQNELKNDFLFRFAGENAVEFAEYLLEIVQLLAKEFSASGFRFSENSNQQLPDFTELYSEALFQTYQQINRLFDLLKTGELELKTATFTGLLKRLLSGVSVPFHGEPARGLQIMGMLETRNMDFRNLIMMSVNESVLPRTGSDASFIPHFIRKFFRMTTVEHQDALYAYYFYRLLQRAENIVLCYNTANSQTGKSEMSRFLLQLLTEYPFAKQIKRINLQTDLQPSPEVQIDIQKTPELIRKIKDKYQLAPDPSPQEREVRGALSPSAFNTFIDCSLRFYFQYIEGIRPPNELSDELDNSVFGKLFHRSSELIYREIGKLPLNEKDFPAFTVSKEQIELLQKSPARIEKIIEKAFDLEFFGNRGITRESYNGEQLIFFNIAKLFIKRLLKLDKEHAPFSIVALEIEKYREIQVGGVILRIGGIVDRIDQKNNVLRVLDYKTGGGKGTNELKAIDDLFIQKDKRAGNIFQTFLYSSILAETSADKIVPSLFYIQRAYADDYSSEIRINKETITDFNDIKAEFDAAFAKKLEELFNPEVPFSQTTVPANCTYCDFRKMCGR